METPDGNGVIVWESKIGEFGIRLDHPKSGREKGGMVYYFEEDLNLEQREEENGS